MQRRATPRELRLRSLLQNELIRRCDRNPRYSLRAFAKALGMSHTNLSLVMSGKRPISKEIQQKILSTLEVEPSTLKTGTPSDDSDSHMFDQVHLDHEAFRGEWHHAAILCLLETAKATVRPKSIARLLGIQEMQARVALDRLRRLGLISNRGGKWGRDKFSKGLEARIPRRLPRKFHEKLSEKAAFALENVDERKRNFAAAIMALDPALIPALMELIAKFRENFQDKAASMRASSEVYALTVQLFPLTTDKREAD